MKIRADFFVINNKKIFLDFWDETIDDKTGIVVATKKGCKLKILDRDIINNKENEKMLREAVL